MKLLEKEKPRKRFQSKMEIEDYNGRSYMSVGDSSLEKDFSEALIGPTVSTPNSRHSSPRRSLSANSIKVEMYSDDESGRLLNHEDRLSEKDDGDMPDDSLVEPLGYCDGPGQDPHSPGGIRLPNGKLKCDICGMVCIGPNVLMVHKRSHTALSGDFMFDAVSGERPFHCNQCGASFTQKGNLLRHIKLHSVSSPTVGKPYKCNYCGRSYKQQNTLEEHKERCHNYLQSLSNEGHLSAHPGEEIRDLDLGPDALMHHSSDPPSFMDRLASNLTKRKRSTPQKFAGEKQVRLSLADLPYDMNSSFEKDIEMVPHHPLDPSYGNPLAFVGGPLRLPPTNCISEITPVISSVYTQLQPMSGRPDMPGNREAAEGHEDIPDVTQIHYRGRTEHGASPTNGCQDSTTDTESNHEERGSQATSSRQSPAYAKEDQRPPEPGVVNPSRSGPGTAKETLRVLGEDGEQVKVFKCEHCRVLFLDHVMFTIHMGCHGFRDPFECNICGYHSQDRYEFSSHIVRGEHKI
ncbi:zinc finger protein Eos isoform X5 [Dendrobates tinctorius]|uniref:zinc finger protein Eos isoform X5 n=1 Tax=Dendrobates tinctorius TaxID=92724 RepID=UPI003CC93DE8